MLNVDGWTDGRTYKRTNERKLARLCLPAKAGATKILHISDINVGKFNKTLTNVVVSFKQPFPEL